MKELAHGNASDKLLKHFFELYKNRGGQGVKWVGKKAKKDIKDNSK